MEKLVNILASRGVLITLAILIVVIKGGMAVFSNQGFSLADFGIGGVWAFTIYCVLKFAVNFAKGYITGKRG
ncbi:hypothetical protein OBP_243 [Pseudomonas phage OBP]|uniref:hypothetical protein n=1 Tax=Pseudomonas phage OBP TaxID=1124849 RepID=UPI000240D5D7|nr:hypothetical protein OBP_243 [Pseudomonas phage OBP]AEV89680.1 hypothetical protein OBP_243 [Pseudomonas phage OBP]